MEQIRRAVELAKSSKVSGLSDGLGAQHPRPPSFPSVPQDTTALPQFGTTAPLKSAHLEANRIIAHSASDPRSIAFDMLRTQVLQAMDASSWSLLGMASPTAGCGKSLVACNLAVSMARHPERSVLLVDLDLPRPSVARYLGFKPEVGVLGVLRGERKLQESITEAKLGAHSLPVLACEASCVSSAEILASRAMKMLLQEIESSFKGWTVIFDLPPLLSGDDAMWVMPQLDCALLVAASGHTTTPEIKQSMWQLESIPIVRTVLNRADESTGQYYKRYSEH